MLHDTTQNQITGTLKQESGKKINLPVAEILNSYVSRKMSAAIMCKNEENNIRHCLQSIEDNLPIDEVILLDTGSTDGTEGEVLNFLSSVSATGNKESSTLYPVIEGNFADGTGDLLPEIWVSEKTFISEVSGITYKLCNTNLDMRFCKKEGGDAIDTLDFSLARNLSFSLCRNEYIFVVDADCVLVRRGSRHDVRTELNALIAAGNELGVHNVELYTDRNKEGKIVDNVLELLSTLNDQKLQRDLVNNKLNLCGTMYQNRLYRKSKIRWVGAIHNQTILGNLPNSLKLGGKYEINGSRYLILNNIINSESAIRESLPSANKEIDSKLIEYLLVRPSSDSVEAGKIESIIVRDLVNTSKSTRIGRAEAATRKLIELASTGIELQLADINSANQELVEKNTIDAKSQLDEQLVLARLVATRLTLFKYNLEQKMSRTLASINLHKSPIDEINLQCITNCLAVSEAALGISTQTVDSAEFILSAMVAGSKKIQAIKSDDTDYESEAKKVSEEIRMAMHRLLVGCVNQAIRMAFWLVINQTSDIEQKSGDVATRLHILIRSTLSLLTDVFILNRYLVNSRDMKTPEVAYLSAAWNAGLAVIHMNMSDNEFELTKIYKLNAQQKDIVLNCFHALLYPLISDILEAQETTNRISSNETHNNVNSKTSHTVEDEAVILYNQRKAKRSPKRHAARWGQR